MIRAFTLRLYPSRTLTSPLSLRPFAQQKMVTCFSALGFCPPSIRSHPVGWGGHAQFHFSLMTNQLEQLFLPNTAHRTLPQMKTLDFSPQCGQHKSCIIKPMSYHQGVRYFPCIFFYLLINLLAFVSFTMQIFCFASIVLIAANVPREAIKSGLDVSTPSGVFVIQKKKSIQGDIFRQRLENFEKKNHFFQAAV